MLARDLVAPLINYQMKGAPLGDKDITALSNDTRNIEQGGAFIAIRGQRFDGHSVIDDLLKSDLNLLVVEEVTEEQSQKASELGKSILLVGSTYRAQAILAHQFYREASSQLDLVAVTGTNGKTTTTTMISEILEALGHRTGLIGTIHYKIGEKILPAVNTTPDALTMHRLYADMLEAGCQDAVIEASSHALALGRLWYSDVDCAIFTNLTREHLDFHKTMDQYAYAKSLLFAQLGQSFHQGKAKLAIINEDDTYADIMIQASGAALATYSLINSQATLYAKEIEHLESSLSFILSYQGQDYRVEIPMLGTYNVKNYMAAFLCLTLYYGYSPEEVIEATQSFQGVAGRMQIIDEGQDFTAVVDFAHTPDALRSVLTELRQGKQGRLLALFGHSGGNRDSAARPELGDILFELADEIIFTADNPRHEPVEKIVNEMVRDHQEKKYTLVEDRQAAIEFALNQAQAGDTILFAGKGGELYQVLGDEYVAYDELAVVRQALQKLRR